VPPRNHRSAICDGSSTLLRVGEAWGCMLARLLTDPISCFLYFWTPKYLENERGFDLPHIGMLAWIPFAVLVVGNVFSGAMSRWLISRRWTFNKARKTTMLVVSCGMVVVCYRSPKHRRQPWPVAKRQNPTLSSCNAASARFFGATPYAFWARLTPRTQEVEESIFPPRCRQDRPKAGRMCPWTSACRFGIIPP
jgi:hypothetical protein